MGIRWVWGSWWANWNFKLMQFLLLKYLSHEEEMEKSTHSFPSIFVKYWQLVFMFEVSSDLNGHTSLSWSFTFLALSICWNCRQSELLNGVVRKMMILMFVMPEFSWCYSHKKGIFLRVSVLCKSVLQIEWCFFEGKVSGTASLKIGLV